ncbi:hypothetical protein [Dactylosporangium sp. NPDC000521]|uniref:hypothetical protein n=1 Tax=Dactylosporangium sp. NPDC000521 TaxID=3363975 RepID=UPI0036780A7B
MRRPGTVDAARWSLLGVAVLTVVSGLLGVVLLDDVRRAYISAYGGMRGGDEATGAAIAGVLAAVVIAVVCAVPALLLGRPRNWARVVAWAICVAGAGCLSPGLLGGGSVTSPRLVDRGAASDEIAAAMEVAMPGWYGPLTVVLAGASVAGVAAAGLLLALPASNAYFRRTPAPVS